VIFAIWVIFVVELAYFASQTKVADFTNAHLVYKDVFQFDVPMDVSGTLVEVSYTPHDLAKHRASVIVR
jgi:hypothetical protein